jgi:hypothetical protein
MNFEIGQLVSAEMPHSKNYPWIYEIVGPLEPTSRSPNTLKVRNFTNGSRTNHSYSTGFLTHISFEEAIRRLELHRDNLAAGKMPPGMPPKKPFNFEERMQELNLKISANVDGGL